MKKNSAVTSWQSEVRVVTPRHVSAADENRRRPSKHPQEIHVMEREGHRQIAAHARVVNLKLGLEFAQTPRRPDMRDLEMSFEIDCHRSILHFVIKTRKDNRPEANTALLFA
jgi:hypothetical protein